MSLNDMTRLLKEKKMKFIIIHDGKKDSSTMANQLNAVISQFDDISTTVWTEKQYLDNKPTLASDK